MPSKRKAAKKEIQPEKSAQEEHPRVEESEAKPVTQVVEVVEEEIVPSAEVAPSQLETLEENEVVENKSDVMDAAKEEVRKEMVDELFDEPNAPVLPEISVHKKSAVNPLIMWVLIVLVVAGITGGGLYIIIQKSAVPLPFLAAEPTPTPMPTPTPTPMPAKREDISIQVLNGGGTPGAAGKMKKLLEEKGYTVADTGNTDEYTYEKTEILVKPGKEAYIALLEEDLKDAYTLGSTSATLSSDGSYDAQVIVGKE
ncbi:MAG: Cell envelope-related transcriptional attenuator [Candidatus Gottesmanbacteria bacterium GW2011_GWA2_47_9]|uniref:Cell envelope-related transcriptional attenuator n=2 Tax=Candidatus Gottesmaniibacteriota TaxID=1752720 RepID=A0A0G1WZR1_9BACT|nr:MAG: Cell envelope-related transcriptional attenuator [Candidatus Gottesmanbacteria bacterium GW2011_GWA2_47_9]KKU95803.1 MAG: Cell envelope-related transcriptional attenuator [Candidatus Gottesmanbacteria bacterium GW2011_GWA1_48_13]